MPGPAFAREKLDALGIDALCDAILDGTTLTEFALTNGVSKASLINWIEADTDRSARAREARRMMASELSERPLSSIANAKDHFELAKAREEAHHIRWMASKIAPAVYGDKLDLNHSGGVKIVSSKTDEAL